MLFLVWNGRPFFPVCAISSLHSPTLAVLVVTTGTYRHRRRCTPCVYAIDILRITVTSGRCKAAFTTINPHIQLEQYIQLRSHSMPEFRLKRQTCGLLIQGCFAVTIYLPLLFAYLQPEHTDTARNTPGVHLMAQPPPLPSPDTTGHYIQLSHWMPDFLDFKAKTRSVIHRLLVNFFNIWSQSVLFSHPVYEEHVHIQKLSTLLMALPGP